MKRIFVFVILFLFVWSAGVAPVYAAERLVPSRALYVSMIQDPQVLSNPSDIKKLAENAQAMKIHVIFIQVYRANQSWFASKHADDSLYQGVNKSQSFDPLLILIQEAHRRGIEVHAWFNVLSLSANGDALILKKYGPQILVHNQTKKNRLEDYKVDNQYFLEPSDPNVKTELLDIVSDLVKNYPQLDGIQFDYIRYPDVDPHYGYSPRNIKEFKKVTGQKDIDESSFVWRDWKRKSVTKLLKALTAQVHGLNPKLKISAAGCVPYVRAYEEAFQDWSYWIDNGIVDFLTLMNYAPDAETFERSLWSALEKTKNSSKIIVSVGAYRFVKDEKTFEEEFTICRDMMQGCAVFHYESLLDNPKLMKFLK